LSKPTDLVQGTLRILISSIGSKQISYDFAPPASMEVVGIVDDIKDGPISGRQSSGCMRPSTKTRSTGSRFGFARAPTEQTVATAIAAAVHEIDHDISVSDPVAMTERIHDSPAAYLNPWSAWLVGSFAGIALVLWRPRTLRCRRLFGQPANA